MAYDNYLRTSTNDQGDETGTPGAVPSGGADVGPLLMVRKAFTVGVGNAADDVTVCTTRQKYRIVKWELITTTQVASKYFKIYPAPAASGTQILDTLTTAGNTTPAHYTGALAAATATLAAGTTIYLRREDNVQAGEIHVWFQPEQ